MTSTNPLRRRDLRNLCEEADQLVRDMEKAQDSLRVATKKATPYVRQPEVMVSEFTSLKSKVLRTLSANPDVPSWVKKEIRELGPKVGHAQRLHGHLKDLVESA